MLFLTNFLSFSLSLSLFLYLHTDFSSRFNGVKGDGSVEKKISVDISAYGLVAHMAPINPAIDAFLSLSFLFFSFFFYLQR